MKKFAGIAILLLCFSPVFSQQEEQDSVISLSKVIITAFSQNRYIPEATASVNVIDRRALARYSNISILQALNNTAGVRMEERSPGSYRINIRGGTLRSTFGVRNTKVYWNDLPLTDPGGNTYLNQLSYYNISSLEIIKGPGSSLYGAGSGGVILLNSDLGKDINSINAVIVSGSYGTTNFDLSVNGGSGSGQHKLDYAHQNSDGYRDHTKMRRDIISYQSSLKSNEKAETKIMLSYGDLYYQTPGGLTKKEYDSAARMARPRAGTLPSADQAKAAIFQKTFLAGIIQKYKFSPNFSNTTSVYGAFTIFKNPTFRVYEKRVEPHMGARTVFQWKKNFNGGSLQLNFGAEGQRGFFNTKTYTNINGMPGSLQTDDDLDNWTWFVFTQAELKIRNDWNFTAGLSSNSSSIRITRLSVSNFQPIKRTFNNVWTPRIAGTKKLFRSSWIYASYSKGFSAPMVSELLPGTVAINTSLQPEESTNLEGGLRANFFKEHLFVEYTHFNYQLKNTIVVRKDAVNGDYYTNAGSTEQIGNEVQLSYRFKNKAAGFLDNGRLEFSLTQYNFHYRQFKQGNTDYSGKKLPGIAPLSVSVNSDLSFKHGIGFNAYYFKSGSIQLNDANSFSAPAYDLVGFKFSYLLGKGRHYSIQALAGIDNLFNTKYSLGNDINAAGDRYYNVASGRTWYAGFKVKARK